MAEIKSTIDLAMEKTRGMSLTDKEKKEFKNRELSGKIRALLERYSRDYMGLKWLETELNNLGMGNDPKIREALKTEILERMIPNGDPDITDKLLEALEAVLGLRTDVYRGLIAEYDKTLAQQREILSEKIKADFSAQMISGSAVVPNVAADPDWHTELEKISAEFRRKIRSA